MSDKSRRKGQEFVDEGRQVLKLIYQWGLGGAVGLFILGALAFVAFKVATHEPRQVGKSEHEQVAQQTTAPPIVRLKLGQPVTIQMSGEWTEKSYCPENPVPPGTLVGFGRPGSGSGRVVVAIGDGEVYERPYASGEWTAGVWIPSTIKPPAIHGGLLCRRGKILDDSASRLVNVQLTYPEGGG